MSLKLKRIYKGEKITMDSWPTITSENIIPRKRTGKVTQDQIEDIWREIKYLHQGINRISRLEATFWSLLKKLKLTWRGNSVMDQKSVEHEGIGLVKWN